jgi:transposase
VETVFADGGYAGRLVKWAKNKTNITLEIVRRMSWMKGFVVIRRRWVVERTFNWIMKCRRLARDCEQLASVVDNPHHHRRNRNPPQAMALSLLKHALRLRTHM